MAATRHALVSGAGIAGPALAYWLTERGWAVTVVERAPGIRPGGSAVDFRGKQTEVLARMGLLDEVRAQQTGMGAQAVIDADGTTLAEVPAAIFSGDVEIERGDLTRILHERTRHRAEYRFGDSITALAQTGADVRVSFASGRSERYDLVVGADGAHSAVRALVFGDESGHRTDLGTCVAGFSAPNTFGLHRSGVIYSEPGRTAVVSSGRHPDEINTLLVWRAPRPTLPHRDTVAHKAFIADAFAGAGWRTPELVARMHDADDLYFDAIGQIELATWSSGRVVLLGDAAWAAGPGGSGTGLAVIAAYVLAGELDRQDVPAALRRYESLLRPAAEAGYKQARGGAKFLAPADAKQLTSRNRAYRNLHRAPMSALVSWLSTRAANKPPLPRYAEAG